MMETYHGFTCPRCGSTVQVGVGSPSCPSCGTEMVPNPAARPNAANVYCPRCKAAYGLVTSDNCPQCGGPFSTLPG